MVMHRIFRIKNKINYRDNNNVVIKITRCE